MKFLLFCLTGWIVLLAFFSCKNAQHVTKQDYTYKKIAYDKFKNDTLFEYSPSNTYVLCSKKDDFAYLNPQYLNIFFVYNMKKKQIVYEDSISGAGISWFSDRELLINIQKGIIMNTEDKGMYQYIYNIPDKTKKPISPNNATK
jgi:hypothetical protein